MEPLRGGMLTRHVPAIDRIWAEAQNDRSAAGWGLRWIWNHPEVTVVLSGMSSLGQVMENLTYADEGFPGSLTGKELKLVGKVRNAYRKRMKVGCTGCGYCMPCNNGVNIPGCFEQYNNSFMFGDVDQPKTVYNMFMSDGCASKCVECGECEAKCPQGIPIPEKLKEVIKLFGK